MNFDQIKEDLDLFSEWEDRYGYIIDLGKQVSLPDEMKTDKNKPLTIRASESPSILNTLELLDMFQFMSSQT